MLTRSTLIFLNGHINPIIELCPRICDETRPPLSKVRLWNHHKSGWALREGGRFFMIYTFKNIGVLLNRSLESERFDN